ncbi:MAG: hypothetical protein F6K56_14470 [Moorea sp. SIO3G5]|nr:hypothetical protein [Moorena sp. SIO3G5]
MVEPASWWNRHLGGTGILVEPASCRLSIFPDGLSQLGATRRKIRASPPLTHPTHYPSPNAKGEQPLNLQPSTSNQLTFKPSTFNLQPVNLQTFNLQTFNLQPSTFKPSNLQPANLQPANLQKKTPNRG